MFVVQKGIQNRGCNQGDTMPQLWSERQKARGVKLALTWWRDRWKKKAGGKVTYFRQPNSAEGYEAALKEWAAAQETAEQREQRELDEGFDFAPIRMAYGSTEIAISAAGQTATRKRAAPNASHPLGEQIDRFLLFKQRQAEAGSRANATWSELQRGLKPAEEFFRPTFPLKNLNGEKVKAFYFHLSERKGRFDKPLSEIRKHNLFRSFKQFVRWYWRQEESQLDALPRCFADPDYTFAVQAAPKTSNRSCAQDDGRTVIRFDRRRTP